MCGCRQLATLPLHADLAITGEPTCLVPIVAQKSILRCQLRIRCPQAHAAYPAEWSALLAAGRLLQAVQELQRTLARHPPAHGLSAPTLTVTHLEDDGEMNKTPSEVRILLDIRSAPDLPGIDILADLRRRLEELEAPVEWIFDSPYFESPANVCEPDLPVIQELIEIIGRVAGQCTPDTFSYGSEAGFLSRIAKASLVFGPGDPKYSHGPAERISLSELEQARCIYAGILQSQQL